MSETILLVAVCSGARCSALRRMHDPSEAEADAPGARLRAAVRNRKEAVLVSTPCLGPCHQGSVVAVGWGSATVDARIEWRGRPIGLGMVELPERAIDLAGWIRQSAPDLHSLPDPLRGASAL